MDLEAEAAFQESIVRELRRLHPGYCSRTSIEMWGVPYQEMMIGYLEPDDVDSLCFRTVGGSASQSFERRDFSVPHEFAKKRGLSGDRGVIDAGWGLVAYATQKGDVKFDVIKYPHPEVKE